MRLGILNACTPQDEIDFASEELPTFTQFFDLVEHDLELVEYRITEGEFPDSAESCDAYLITGSPKGAYDNDPWIAQLADFIRDSHAQKAQMVGICFGHQILAHALGGRAEKSEKGWGMGAQPVAILAEKTWMTPSLPQGQFYFCHQDQVTALPDGAERLAGNAFCPNGMFMLGDNILGMQLHPEFTERIMGKAVDGLRPIVDADVVDAAEATINRETNNEVIASWIVNFLEAGKIV